MAKNELKKRAALEALSDSSTLTEAAEKAGISRRTLYAYIREDLDFSKAYKSLHEQSILSVYDTAVEQRNHASEVLKSIMDDETQSGAIRLKAAQTIIDKADKLEAKVGSIAASHVSANHSSLDDMFGKSIH